MRVGTNAPKLFSGEFANQPGAVPQREAPGSVFPLQASNHEMSIGLQIVWLFVLAIPIACIAWTFTHEEVFREPREYCAQQSKTAPGVYRRKFFYLFTCEYCFSHYITVFFLIITGYKLLYEDWRGYLISFFALVWVANMYMSGFGRLRLDIKKERLESRIVEEEIKEKTDRDKPDLEVAA
jgi:hypothetical protein